MLYRPRLQRAASPFEIMMPWRPPGCAAYGRASDCVFPSNGRSRLRLSRIDARGMVLWDRPSLPFNLPWACNTSADATPRALACWQRTRAALRRLMASDAPARANRVSRRCAATKPGWRGTASRRMAAFRKKYVLRSTGLYSDLIVLPAQLACGYSTSNSAHRESLQRSTSIKPGSDCRQSIVSLPCLSFFHEAGFDASSSTSAQCLKGL